MARDIIKAITKKDIAELETRAWVGFDSKFKPMIKSEFEILDEKKGYFDPDVGAWSENSTSGKPIVLYEGSPIFIRTYLIAEGNPVESYMYFFDASYNGKGIDWTLRNATKRMVKSKPVANRQPERILTYASLIHDDDIDSLKSVPAKDMFKHPLINEIMKAPMQLKAEDLHGILRQDTETTNYLATIINPEEAEITSYLNSTSDSGNMDIVFDFFNAEEIEYSDKLLTKLFYVLENNFSQNRQGVFKLFSGQGYSGLKFLIGSELYQTLNELLNILPFEDTWINTEALDIEDMFGVPKRVLTHAAHRGCMDSLEHIEKLKDLWEITGDIRGYFEFFEYMDEKIKEYGPDYEPKETFKRVISLINDGNNLEKAIEILEDKRRQQDELRQVV